MKKIKEAVYSIAACLGAPLFVAAAAALALVARFREGRPPRKSRLVWGPTPIFNNVYWSRAMRLAGFESETFTDGYYGTAHQREDWGLLLQERYRGVPSFVKPYLAFLESLLRYDIFFLSFNGFFIGLTPLWRFEAVLLRLARKKTVVIPIGSDSYVYGRIKSTALTHGLMMSYPGASRQQTRIAARVDYWCAGADFVLPGFMGPDGFGRWDVLLGSPLHIDTDQWNPSKRRSLADGTTETVVVAHAPNHRGFKGSEFVISAVDGLRSQGLNVELVLLENLQNAEVRETLESKVDILIEQLIFTGHGLNGLEGMASGLPVLSNLEDESYTLPLRRWSYLDECPIVSASPETLIDVLRKLVTRPGLRHRLGTAGREYVEKYHGLDSAQYLFGEVIEYLHGNRASLINLYHPLLGEYPRRKPRVEHPLVKNRIVG